MRTQTCVSTGCPDIESLRPASVAAWQRPATGRSLFVAALMLFCALASAQEAPQSQVTPAIQAVRWAMLDADVNALTFRSMDRIFDTRLVGRMGPV
jgi:hypothetical protein